MTVGVRAIQKPQAGGAGDQALRTNGPHQYSIVIPAKNEEQTIGDVLRKVSPMTDDLIVVDGHSSDGTAAIAQQHGASVVHDHGLGKGDAVRVGLQAARHAITVFIDADGSHDPNDIPKLVGPITRGEADLVIGSRMLGGSDELFSSISEMIRLLGSLLITLSINYRFGVRLTDYQNGFRAIRTAVGRSLGLTSNLTTIEQEMAMKCLRYGYRVIERPAHEYRRKGGVSKINVVKVAHLYLWNLLTGLCGRSENGRDPLTVSPPALPSSQPSHVCCCCGTSQGQGPIPYRRDLVLLRCSRCGLIYQANQPSTSELSALYGDGYYDHWMTKGRFDDVWAMKVKTCRAYLLLLEPYLQRGASSPRLLDIGCAHGFMLEAARQQGLAARGIEPSPAASVGRERGLTVYDLPLPELSLPPATVDVVTLIDVLEHVPDPLGFMREIHRILKPQGLVLIVTPDGASFTAKLMRARWPHYKKEHLFYFGRRSLSLLMQEAGFSMERIGLAFKYLSFDYILGHFEKYTPGRIESALVVFHRLLPARLTRLPVRLPTELLAIARRGTPST